MLMADCLCGSPGSVPGQDMWDLWYNSGTCGTTVTFESFFNIRPTQWRTLESFFGGVSTNSVEDRGQRERESEGGSPLVRGSTQFSNE
jgi:hypothetical protein